MRSGALKADLLKTDIFLCVWKSDKYVTPYKKQFSIATKTASSSKR
jgi:hypothetical protein